MILAGHIIDDELHGMAYPRDVDALPNENIYQISLILAVLHVEHSIMHDRGNCISCLVIL